MNVRVIKKNGKAYVEGIPGKKFIKNDQDAVDVVGMCGQNCTNLVMLHDDNVISQFFDLSSCIAGNVLQKFITYRIKVAAVLKPERMKGRFKEMADEANSGTDFRVFFDRQEAEEWLLSGYRWPVV